MMVPGHCRCTPRHRGNAGFMVAVLLSGLKYYHDVTGDERVKACIIRGAHYLLDETYSDETNGFRYTSCPKTAYRRGASPLMAEGIARAYLWTKAARLGRVLTEAVPMAAGGSSYGKGFSMYYRTAPRVLADLAAANTTLLDWVRDGGGEHHTGQARGGVAAHSPLPGLWCLGARGRLRRGYRGLTAASGRRGRRYRRLVRRHSRLAVCGRWRCRLTAAGFGRGIGLLFATGHAPAPAGRCLRIVGVANSCENRSHVLDYLPEAA